MSDPQRRATARRPLRGAGNFVLHPPYMLDVRLLDVSVHGVGLISASNLPSGVVGTINFSVPGEDGKPHLIKTSASVIDCVLTSEGFRLGLRFDSLLDAAEAAIDRYVRSMRS